MNDDRIFLNSNGLTLVELMIVLVLSMLLMTAVYLAYQVQHRESTVQHQVTAMQQDLRAVLDIMERDIRNAGCNPHYPQITLVGIASSSGVFPSQNVTKLGLNMDIDGDGTISGSDESVSYEWHHNTKILERNHLELAGNIESMLIAYYDSGGTDITPASGTQLGSNAADVRVIDITLETRSEDRDPETGNYLTRSFNRMVRGRNLGLY